MNIQGVLLPMVDSSARRAEVKTAEVRDNVGIGVEILAKSAWLTISAK